jgi:hypothetical protein
MLPGNIDGASSQPGVMIQLSGEQLPELIIAPTGFSLAFRILRTGDPIGFSGHI